MSAYLPVFVALAGLLLYGFANNAKVAEVGRLLFFAGILAFLLRVPERIVNLLG